MENLNTGNKIKNANIEKIEERIVALQNNEDATLADATGDKKIEKQETNLEKEREIVELFEKKLRDFCYSYISLNIAVEKSEDIPLIEKELEEKGIQIKSKDIKDIGVFLNKLAVTKEQIDNLKEKLETKEKESFEDFLRRNNDLDNIMLYEICVKKVKKGTTFEEDYPIKNQIEEILDDYDIFNDDKNTWTVLKKETENGKYKNQIRLIELEQKMEETYNRKVQKFLGDEYRDIFIRDNN